MQSIVRISNIPDGFESLLQESLAENFNFLGRLKSEYLSLENTFNKCGEELFGVFCGNNLIAIGGINQQSPSIARLRRFYVSPTRRQQGVGSLLLKHIELNAFQCFEVIVLNTDTDKASMFYEAHSYTKVNENGITHRKHRST